MKASTKERKVQLFKPEQAHKPMKSAKTQRNWKCYCGSGKKQKHCCGDKQIFI